jgi:calcineurin-like phosphoesterase family protein
MKVYLISDTHFNHGKIATYCDRPADFTDVLIRNWQQIVQPSDLIIHVGDVFIGQAEGWKKIYPELPGRKILIRGNHDWHHNCTWWMQNGFDFACDAFIFRHIYLTHKPVNWIPPGTHLNIHGHLHNIWHGFHKNEPDTERITRAGKLRNPWQRLFSVEYTDYKPVEFEQFINEPDRFQARGPEAAKHAQLAAQYDAAQKRERRANRLANHICRAAGCCCPKALASRTPESIAENYGGAMEYD